MAKPKENPVVPGIAPDAPIAGATPPVVAPPALTSEQGKALGQAFLAAAEAANKAEEVYEAARQRKSEATRAIVESFGHKGPFKIGGRLWSASVSKSTGFHSMSENSGPRAEL